jgi:uncharacterized caspase-like protein
VVYSNRLTAGLARFARALTLVVAALLPANAEDARASRGVALVVGQSRYQHIAALPNPGNDARAVAKMLSDLGFEVTSVADGDRGRLSRSVQRFIEDAAGADVALLYYSGHGVEAGGENYLVPVEVDLPSLADADRSLVPLSPLLAELRAAVPVAIVLLDACRTSPFPRGATLTSAVGTAPVSTSGLARGAAPFQQPDAPENLGQVIGFAAEPGHAALDGDPGGNSPYAAALLKHLAAGGFDFGDVMTMVSEEVYLRTGGRQLPWTNTSLRRILYFGLSPEETASDEASILGERRKLLLTIAATPADRRAVVESVAADNDVPLDALYGMLGVLEVDTTGGPKDLQHQLAVGAERLRTILAERDVRIRQDPELIRISGLADRAESEGAIALALEFRARASARADVIDKAIDEQEAEVAARRKELADTFASHAQTALINFDYRTAAAKYSDASAQLERWDPARAFLYKVSQADALTDQGMIKGDNAALMEAIEVYEQAKRMPGVDAFAGGAVGVAVNQGITLITLADRENGTRWIEQAIAVYEDALRNFSRKRAPEAWATVQLNLGNAYDLMGERAGGTAYHKKALQAFRQAAAVFTASTNPDAWAGLQNNIGNALVSIGEAGDGKKTYAEAVKAFEAALTVWTREASPSNWAMAEHNLGATLYQLGELQDSTSNLEAAVVALSAALEVRSRETQPMDWAGSQNNLGSALLSLGQRGKGVEYFERAIEALANARLEITRERDPFNWASVTYNSARALKLIGDAENSPERYRQALAEVELALAELDRDASPALWGRAVSVRGDIMLAVGMHDSDRSALDRARQDYVSAREIFRDQKFATKFESFYAKQLKRIDEALAKLP